MEAQAACSRCGTAGALLCLTCLERLALREVIRTAMWLTPGVYPENRVMVVPVAIMDALEDAIRPN
jgi:hypothetical protein